MSADREFVNYLQQKMYHPRSSAHGNKLIELILRDLVDVCEPFRIAAREGKIVYKINYSVDKDSPTAWNLDLVVGPPLNPQKSLSGELMEGEPAEIWIGLDQKTVMTEHGKTRRNRQRDLDALYNTLHRKNPKTIVGALMVVNLADRFKSPLRPEVTVHKNVERLVRETIDLYRGLPLSKRGGAGLDALGIIVITHTNLQGDTTRLVSGEPSPPPDDPLNYRSFLNDLCQAFRTRFG